MDGALRVSSPETELKNKNLSEETLPSKKSPFDVK